MEVGKTNLERNNSNIFNCLRNRSVKKSRLILRKKEAFCHENDEKLLAFLNINCVKQDAIMFFACELCKML